MRHELEDKNSAPPTIGSPINSDDFFAQFKVVGLYEEEDLDSLEDLDQRKGVKLGSPQKKKKKVKRCEL